MGMNDDTIGKYTLLTMCGYSYEFSRDLFIVLIVTIIVMTALTILFLLKRLFKHRSKPPLVSKEISNFMHRFSYVFYFEMFLCSLLELTSPLANTVFGWVIWFIAVCRLLALIALAGFVLSRFFVRGPYI